jgi:hypothetical protein
VSVMRDDMTPSISFLVSHACTDSGLVRVKTRSLEIPNELSKALAIFSSERVVITSCLPKRWQIPSPIYQNRFWHSKYRQQSI